MKVIFLILSILFYTNIFSQNNESSLFEVISEDKRITYLSKRYTVFERSEQIVIKNMETNNEVKVALLGENYFFDERNRKLIQYYHDTTYYYTSSYEKKSKIKGEVMIFDINSGVSETISCRTFGRYKEIIIKYCEFPSRNRYRIYFRCIPKYTEYPRFDFKPEEQIQFVQEFEVNRNVLREEGHLSTSEKRKSISSKERLRNLNDAHLTEDLKIFVNDAKQFFFHGYESTYYVWQKSPGIKVRFSKKGEISIFTKSNKKVSTLNFEGLKNDILNYDFVVTENNILILKGRYIVAKIDYLDFMTKAKTYQVIECKNCDIDDFNESELNFFVSNINKIYLERGLNFKNIKYQPNHISHPSYVVNTDRYKISLLKAAERAGNKKLYQQMITYGAKYGFDDLKYDEDNKKVIAYDLKRKEELRKSEEEKQKVAEEKQKAAETEYNNSRQYNLWYVGKCICTDNGVKYVHSTIEQVGANRRSFKIFINDSSDNNYFKGQELWINVDAIGGAAWFSCYCR